MRSNLLEDRRAKLSDLLSLARQAVATDYQVATKSGLPKEEAVARAKTILHNFKFGANDCFFAFDKDGVIVAHPNPKLEGAPYWNVADPDGVFFARDMIAAAAKGGGYVADRFPPARGRCCRSPLMRCLSRLTNGRSRAASISTTSMRSFGPRRSTSDGLPLSLS